MDFESDRKKRPILSSNQGNQDRSEFNGVQKVLDKYILTEIKKICLLFFSWELLIETQKESLYNSWCFKICYNTAKLKVRVQVLQFQTIDQ